MQDVISSRANQYIKLARALEQKKMRRREGLFVAEGRRNIAEALGGRCKPVFALYDCEKAAELAELLHGLEDMGAKLYPVVPEVLQSAAHTEETQGIVLVLKLPEIGFADFARDCGGKTIAVLDGLRDPGNVGTILRTAWAAGLGGVIFGPDCVDPYSPKVVRSAMGAVYQLPVLQVNDNEEIEEFLREHNYQAAAADLGGADFREFQPEAGKNLAWILGAEAAGVSEFWRARAAAVTIPMASGVESLNVGVAAGILFFAVANCLK